MVGAGFSERTSGFVTVNDVGRMGGGDTIVVVVVVVVCPD